MNSREKRIAVLSGEAHPQKENAPVVEPYDYYGWLKNQRQEYPDTEVIHKWAEGYATYRVEFERARLQTQIEAADRLFLTIKDYDDADSPTDYGEVMAAARAYIAARDKK